jgi:hypothetical protein
MDEMGDIASDPVREVDVARHAGDQAPRSAVPPPQLGSDFDLDGAVLRGK